MNVSGRCGGIPGGSERPGCVARARGAGRESAAAHPGASKSVNPPCAGGAGSQGEGRNEYASKTHDENLPVGRPKNAYL